MRLRFKVLPFAISASSAIVLTLLACNGGPTDPDAPFDLEPFKDMARAADCDDVTNRLFLIDGAMVFWDRHGSCADGSFGHGLFGGTVDDDLCNIHDSPAGPIGGCWDPAHQLLFDTITQNHDASDLGLDPTHSVERILF